MGGNVAFTSNRLWQLSESEIFEVIGAPETEELAGLDGNPLDKGLPRQLTKATGWENWIDEDEEDIRIFDLGEAFPQGAEPEKLSQPVHLRAPETIFMDRCDNRHDLWRAGIMIRLFLFGAFPFQYWYNDGLVAQMIYFVEDLPTEWQQEWVNMRQESGPDRSLGSQQPAIAMTSTSMQPQGPTNPHHRKIELQSPLDLTYLQANLWRCAQQKSDEKKQSREKEQADVVRALVSAFLSRTWANALPSISINGLDSHSREDIEGVDYRYAAFDGKLQQRVASLYAEVEALTAQVSRLRREAPARGAAAYAEADDGDDEKKEHEQQIKEEGLPLEEVRSGWHENVQSMYERGVDDLTVGKAQRARSVAMEFE
ncbi:hypothetical protein DV738_g488, partial [Chaetothyriales sp. CBS 135597]